MEAGSTLWVARVFGAAVGWGWGQVDQGSGDSFVTLRADGGTQSLAGHQERPGCRAVLGEELVGMFIPCPRLPPMMLRGTRDPHGEGPVGRPKA